jgi:glycosyltransferase involved in cell wall biosynthesis
MLLSMSEISAQNVLWLIPSLGRGPTGYPWHPVFKEFTRLFPNTHILTTRWPGFAQGYEGTFSIKTVGKPLQNKLFKPQAATEYGAGFMPLPLSVFFDLFSLKPNVIFTKAFSIWTALAVIYKLVTKSRVIIAYEGSSPGVDYSKSVWRTRLRALMSAQADAFVTNSHAGKAYLTDVLGADPNCVFVRPYEVASPHLLFESEQPGALEKASKQPVFITVGQLIPRKGIALLLEACMLLKSQGLNDYTVWIAGKGPQQEELEAKTEQAGLSDQVKFLGWVDYSSLGYYFNASDVFVFPTLADTWGLVTLEAMAIGKPAICSQYAGTAEMVAEGENGYVIDPQKPQMLADRMKVFIQKPELAIAMGEKAKQSMSRYSPEVVAQSLQAVVSFVMSS